MPFRSRLSMISRMCYIDGYWTVLLSSRKNHTLSVSSSNLNIEHTGRIQIPPSPGHTGPKNTETFPTFRYYMGNEAPATRLSAERIRLSLERTPNDPFAQACPRPRYFYVEPAAHGIHAFCYPVFHLPLSNFRTGKVGNRRPFPQ